MEYVLRFCNMFTEIPKYLKYYRFVQGVATVVSPGNAPYRGAGYVFA
jgi:hypothetical protein